MAALLAAGPARAQSPSFEGQLDAVQRNVFHAIKEQRDARKSAGAQELDAASRDTQMLDSALGQVRWTVQDVRRRAAWIDPTRGRDWFFEADVQRLRTTLRDLQERLDRLDSTVARMAREAQADPALAGPAARLVQAARGLRLEAGRLVNDARWARHELARAAMAVEGNDIEAACAASLMDAFNVEHAAQRLAKKVNP